MGDRAFTGVQDHEIGLGLPSKLLPAGWGTTFSIQAGGEINMGQRKASGQKETARKVQRRAGNPEAGPDALRLQSEGWAHFPSELI